MLLRNFGIVQPGWFNENWWNLQNWCCCQVLVPIKISKSSKPLGIARYRVPKKFQNLGTDGYQVPAKFHADPKFWPQKSLILGLCWGSPVSDSYRRDILISGIFYPSLNKNSYYQVKPQKSLSKGLDFRPAAGIHYTRTLAVRNTRYTR